MSLRARRRDAALAERCLLLERAEWDAQTRTMRDRMMRHREAWIVGGGFAGGLATSLLPLRGLVRIGSLLASTLRTPVSALFVRDNVDCDDAAHHPEPRA
ncbi:hypothetical protein [Dokdonella soli]|uniref:Uncharacterized protein n=1 Tax=Dokdonella soli TaxID=529810 RepID=A0ABN1IP89_9GAMM